MEHAPCTSSALSGEAVSELAVRAHELHSTGIHPALQRAAAQPETPVHRSIFPSPTTRCQATECARHVSIMRSICVMQQWVKSLSPKAQSVDRAPPVEGASRWGGRPRQRPRPIGRPGLVLLPRPIRWGDEGCPNRSPRRCRAPRVRQFLRHRFRQNVSIEWQSGME
jgi:hypothetical protein